MILRSAALTRSFAPDWLRQREGRRPAFSDSSPYEVVGHLSVSRPLRDGLANAFDLNDVARAPVVGLLANGCPSHVVRTVIAGIVNALQCVHWARSLADVVKKALKGIPFAANGDPSAAISRVAWVRRVIAALTHAEPRHVCSGLIQSVLGVSGRRRVSAKASARATVSRLKACSEWRHDGAAFASAHPSRPVVSLTAAGKRYHRESSEDGADHSLILPRFAPAMFARSPCFIEVRA